MIEMGQIKMKLDQTGMSLCPLHGEGDRVTNIYVSTNPEAHSTPKQHASLTKRRVRPAPAGFAGVPLALRGVSRAGGSRACRDPRGGSWCRAAVQRDGALSKHEEVSYQYFIIINNLL